MDFKDLERTLTTDLGQIESAAGCNYSSTIFPRNLRSLPGKDEAGGRMKDDDQIEKADIHGVDNNVLLKRRRTRSPKSGGLDTSVRIHKS
jgi:hypothetical protein